MTMIRMFCVNSPNRSKDGNNIYDDMVIDLNINSADGFLHNGDVKTIFWNDSKPYGYHMESKRYVRFNTLHFQGKAKPLMPKYMPSVIF